MNIYLSFVYSISLLITGLLAAPQDSFEFVKSSEAEDDNRFLKADACPNGKHYCSDRYKYPKFLIEDLFEKSILNSSKDLRVKFFENNKDKLNDGVNPACKSQIKFIPRNARARNIKGKWKYLLQGSNGQRQHIQITVCSNPDSKCRNDKDSPSTNRKTFCKQIYKIQRMLAVNDDGEVVVDSFELPSACVCYTSEETFGLRSDLSNFKKALTPKTFCESSEQSLMSERLASASSKVIFPTDISTSERFSQRSSMFSEFISSCKDGQTICEDNLPNYPNSQITNVVNQHSLFSKNSTLFQSVFGPVCSNYQDQNTNLFVLKSGFDLDEEALCESHQRYIFPQKAQNIHNQWRYIVNVPNYRQGVTVETCLSSSKDQPCKYGGVFGNFPDSTKCRQIYSAHEMFAINEDGSGIELDTFKIPSACICHIDPIRFP